MYRKTEITPLSEGMVDAISKSINRLEYVSEADRKADKLEGDTKAQDISGEEPVKTDGSATKAPARKGDQSQADSMEKVKEEVELDEAKLPVAKIQKMVDDGKSMDVIVGTFANKRTTNTDEIRQVVKDYMWKKRMKKEGVEITDLHMSLLEAHGIEAVVAERVKKVFDAMTKEDKDAFMESYLKDPKAATENMFGEEAQPKWKVQIGKNHYTVTARNTAEANQKAKKLAAKDGNNGVGGKIERINEGTDPVNAKALKGKHSERKDKDIDNDGDVDSSDEFLHKRRQAISKALKKEEVELDEAKDNYTINHKTFSSAVQHAIDVVKKRGYEVDEDDWDRKVALGPKKPSAGKTNRYTIDLMKNGKKTKKKLQMQVYYDEGRYELNMYIS